MKREMKLVAALALVGASAWAAGVAIDEHNRQVNGNLTVRGNLTVNGTTTAYFPYDAGVLTSAVIDAGTINVQGKLGVAGPIALASGTPGVNAGSAWCDGGTPTWTTTVRTGAYCVCNRTTGAACTVSSTTLSVPCVAGNTANLDYLCLGP